MDTYLLTCPSCGTDNRIPADREGKRGQCGNCRSLLPPLYYRPQPLEEETFDTFAAAYPGPLVAEFWAPW